MKLLRVRAGDYTQAARICSNRVEIERHLDLLVSRRWSFIRVPLCIANIQIAIGRHVYEPGVQEL